MSWLIRMMHDDPRPSCPHLIQAAMETASLRTDGWDKPGHDEPTNRPSDSEH
jgi:hypothetical protein